MRGKLFYREERHKHAKTEISIIQRKKKGKETDRQTEAWVDVAEVNERRLTKRIIYN